MDWPWQKKNTGPKQIDKLEVLKEVLNKPGENPAHDSVLKAFQKLMRQEGPATQDRPKPPGGKKQS